MKTFQKLVFAIVLITLITSCSVFRDNSVPDMKTCPVCGMKVSKTDAYKYKYEDKKYYFDKINCKETFKMTPKKFIDNKSTVK